MCLSCSVEGETSAPRPARAKTAAAARVVKPVIKENSLALRLLIFFSVSIFTLFNTEQSFSCLEARLYNFTGKSKLQPDKLLAGIPKL
jgi:hypothetical protein